MSESVQLVSPVPLADQSDDDLLRECRVFTRLLVDGEPTGYIEARYLDAQKALGNPASASDRLMLEFAASGPIAARIADAYACVLAPRGLLRQKLILLFAILENTREYQHRFLAGGNGGRFLALVRIAGAIGVAVMAMGAGFVLLGPRDVICRYGPAAR